MRHARSCARCDHCILKKQKRLLETAAGHTLHALVTVGLGCGLGLGESLGLQWTDVNLEAGTMRVRRALQRFGGGPTVRRTLLAERKRLIAALRAARKKWQGQR